MPNNTHTLPKDPHRKNACAVKQNEPRTVALVTWGYTLAFLPSRASKKTMSKNSNDTHNAFEHKKKNASHAHDYFLVRWRLSYLLHGENLAPRCRGSDVDHEDLLPLQLLHLGLLASLLGLDAQQAAEEVKADLHLFPKKKKHKNTKQKQTQNTHNAQKIEKKRGKKTGKS